MQRFATSSRPRVTGASPGIIIARLNGVGGHHETQGLYHWRHDRYLQAASPDRHARVQKYGLEFESFTVCAGDEWNPGVKNGDASKFSERTEFRSKTVDIVGDGKWYKYVIPVLIPLDYPEFSPKQTFAQWHEGDHPVASLRYENGVLEFVTNYASDVFCRKALPFNKGQLVLVVAYLRFDPGIDAGDVLIQVDGETVLDWKRHSLVESGTASTYFKYGIYRLGMNGYKGPKPAPSQMVMFGQVSRTMLDQLVVLPTATTGSTPPTATTLPPIIPTPPPDAPFADTIYDRIGAIQWQLVHMEADVATISPSSTSFLEGAGEKLQKLVDQLKKAEAKKTATVRH